MNTNRSHRLVTYLAAVSLAVCLLGCEGLGFKRGRSVVDIQPPPENATADASAYPTERQNFPDLVEQMLATRQTLLASREYYFEQLRDLERAYLLGGDTIKANWARRQRERLQDVDLDPYPYLTAAPPEHRAEVSPERQIAEADAVFEEAFALLDNVRGIPAKGLLPRSKKKVHKALRLFRKVLREHHSRTKSTTAPSIAARSTKSTSAKTIPTTSWLSAITSGPSHSTPTRPTRPASSVPRSMTSAATTGSGPSNSTTRCSKPRKTATSPINASPPRGSTSSPTTSSAISARG